jgi:hypothetical protein
MLLITTGKTEEQNSHMKFSSLYMPLIFIISGTGAAVWSGTNFGLTGHHHP